MAQAKPQEPSPLAEASLWSRFWFAWNKPLLDLGLERPLDNEDIPAIEIVDQSHFNREHIEKLWEDEKKRGGSLAVALFREFFHSTWPSRLLIMLNSLSKIGQAVALGILLDSLEEEGNSYSSYIWAIVIILCGLIAFPTKQHSFFQLYRKGARYRSGLMATIYAKTLRLPSIRSGDNGSIGTVTNLASNDVERFVLTAIYANILLASPVEISTILVIGIWTVGPVFACGYALLMILVPLQFWLSRRFVYFRGKIAKLTDTRVSLVSQAITGARVLKLQGWELELERKISELRAEEVQQLQRTNRLKGMNNSGRNSSSHGETR